MSFCAPNSVRWARPSPRFALVATASLLASACLVTTYREPGHAPAVASDEPPPGSESEGPAAGEPTPTEPESIAASHILIQYQGAERAAAAITRTKDEARARADEALLRAKAGEAFATLVTEYSDEPGAGERGGKLGNFTREVMVPEFADAAFGLDVGELSGVVESPFGFHVILRDE